ncbi:MAG TPA: transposase [Thermoanaerobaculia bacterium]|nr:transposase [Thermoanaerobaculia bacterium]
MSRPLRIEFPGALYHLTNRGVEQRDTYRSDDDRRLFLRLLQEAVRRFRWTLYTYVLMSNHFHLLLQLSAETLSTGMKWLEGGYAQAFNKRHDRFGHLFQARFDAKLVEKETYLFNVLRYDVLNPVRAGMVGKPEDYEWSSYRATAGLAPIPPWLAVDEVLMNFGDKRDVAQPRYRNFIQDAIGSTETPWADLVGQMYLGSEGWVQQMREKVESRPRDTEHPREQRFIGRWGMEEVLNCVASGLGVSADLVRAERGGEARMLAAWLGCYEAMLTLSAIAAALRVRSASHVSRLIRKCDERLNGDATLRSSVDRCRELLYRV